MTTELHNMRDPLEKYVAKPQFSTVFKNRSTKSGGLNE